jgi:Carbon-nitrogen hydrolase
VDRKLFALIFTCVILATAYFLWARLGRQFLPEQTYTGKIDWQQFGEDSGKGNIVSIQPYMFTWDYASEKSFYDALNGYLRDARLKGWLRPNTIVSFPEYLGTWLVLAGEKKAVFAAPTIQKAMDIMAVSDLTNYLPELITSKARDKSEAALFRMKGKEMASLYQHVFSGLARQYGVTIVAGSIVLPDPAIMGDSLVVSDGALFNVTVVYKPDGRPEKNIVRKAYPVAEELPFTCNESAGNIPVYQTAAGKMAILICADSWYAPCYKNAMAQKVDFIIVPSYVEGDGAFKQPWPGYSGFANPNDVDTTDIGKITILDGWVKYALPGKMKQAGIQNGIITYLHGKFWNLGSDAHLVLVKGGQPVVKQPEADAAVVNLWL